MPYEFKLPELSQETEEGIVVAWFKREGAQVTAGENLLEVQLAKVSYDVQAPISGTLEKILAPRDAVVKQGQVLAHILQSDQVETNATSAQSPPPTAAAVAPAQTFVPASPAARRLASERGIDLAMVKGSGPEGRVSEDDVLRYISAASAYRTEPLSPTRKIIARRMTESLQTTAQLTLTTEADVTALVALREKLQPLFDVTYTDLIAQAVAHALAKHPQLNARLMGDALQVWQDVNIGIAVARETGLIVPVLRAVNRKSLREISAAAKELIERARAGALTEQDLTEGTFTLTNLGMYGIDAFTPVLNPPEIAILGVGRIVERAARKSKRGGVLWKQMLTLSLTIDHRAVDGAPAAAFLQTLCQHLQSPADENDT